MKANRKFLEERLEFWANIKTISESAGYTEYRKGVKNPSIEEILSALQTRGFSTQHIVDKFGHLTNFGKRISEYFKYRADILNEYVEPRLMDAEKAKEVYTNLKETLSPKCSIVMNKQKKEKYAPAYFTNIINFILETNSEEYGFVIDPRNLSVVSKDSIPIRTFSRRFDGAFIDIINPIAVWEIKEYYYTTTFGSRIADGVYETILDGMELAELRENEDLYIIHCIMVDSHRTFWEMGKSYLCRFIDLLNMGYADEVLFGYEIVERFPSIVRDWVKKARSRK